MDPGGKYGPEGGAVCGPALADSLRGVSIHRRCNQVIRVPSKQEALGFRIVAFYMYFTFRTVWLFLAAAGTLTVPWQPPCLEAPMRSQLNTVLVFIGGWIQCRVRTFQSAKSLGRRHTITKLRTLFQTAVNRNSRHKGASADKLQLSALR
eukprot:2686556-Rhodomonas_salina.2